MTVGYSAGFLNSALGTIGSGASPGTAFTADAGCYAKLHTADPGVGATAASANVTRVAISFAVASGGSRAMTGTAPVWTNAGTGETISHITLWDAITAGNFRLSGALTAPQAWVSTNTLTLTGCTLSFTPVAA